MVRRWRPELEGVDPMVPFPVDGFIMRKIAVYGFMTCLEDGGVVHAAATLPWVSHWNQAKGAGQWALPDFDPTIYEITEDGMGFSASDGPDGNSHYVGALASQGSQIWLSVGEAATPEVAIRVFQDTVKVGEYQGEDGMKVHAFFGDDWIVAMDRPGPELYLLRSPLGR